MKKKVKWVHVFGIVIDANDVRYTRQFNTFFKLFGDIFGKQFWKNVVIVVTKWSFNDDSVALRKSVNITEKVRAKEMIGKICENFPQIPVSG